ncbi:putative signal-transduction protein containing cAMP-binding and CBS domains [[Clostridium] sordellii]|uniref:CBS domain-containing protein n=1 Tax=Paraclostridium sordellii TaxID=1505 RepID=UPI0005DF58FD|nr:MULTISPECIES: CBS domain-containing protein [Paeniclostridium]MBW4863944.1 CBS domain-containing protein [Paeniclostridium sp.]MBW4874441.1 CBS domain-containing protein [Paeniclostridium sp.]CEN91156.1 putative signal-transduction protein containing cAMP-binding and CBS domains [[Clostridium] sordellii] [Paeniclostridium sordellii]CEN97657.1 putative signal-transduction protein containing cAMP-binding and CBS domains [[Clostridium] sordellii] [Paeniclostridium sordellii]CEN98383.1 putative
MKTKKAKDIMTTNVKVAKETDTISDIANTLISEKIGGLPVVDENNKVVGIISETDIIKKEKYINPPEYITFLQGLIYLDDFKKMEHDIKDVAATQVKDLMSTDVVKVHEDDTFDDVANIMIKKSVNRVPVVDQNNKIKGIICRYDIIKSMYEN